MDVGKVKWRLAFSLELGNTTKLNQNLLLEIENVTDFFVYLCSEFSLLNCRYVYTMTEELGLHHKPIM